MESAYFTPDIEDFYVGYEFQGKIYGEEDQWVNCVYSKPTDEMFCKDSDGNVWINDSIRVPYLTKEQIEAEGWKIESEIKGYFKFKNYHLSFDYVTGLYRMRISKDEDLRENLIFEGTCKDINTFRKICKLLGI
jgi:hypothetical protein